MQAKKTLITTFIKMEMFGTLKPLKRTKKTFGKVNAVIHCAGVATAGTIIYSKGTASTSEMERVLQINVVGSFNVAKLAAKAMSEQP